MHDGTVEAIPLRPGMTFRISVPEIAVDPPTGGADHGPQSIAGVARQAGDDLDPPSAPQRLWTHGLPIDAGSVDCR